MNQKWKEFKRKIKGKKVALLGAGISNRPLIPLFADLDAKVTVCDKNESIDRETLSGGREIQFRLGEDYLSLSGFDYIFKSPGMRYDLPELVEARKNGSIVTSEMEVFMDLCEAQVIGVTGSDGKTTTTTLIYKILSEQGYRCWLGGNIGTPLLSKIEQIMPEDKVVLELSSFQLQTMTKSPQIAVVTNLSPNHLDMHKSYEEYIEAKKHIFWYQQPGDRLVLNLDNSVTRSFDGQAKGEVCGFSRKERVGHGVYYENGSLISTLGDKDIVVLKKDDIVIPGDHNIENYMAAIAATATMVESKSVLQVAHTFRGAEHRNEFVRKVNGVSYYNSSIDSSPNRTKATLSVFNKKVILIAGGKDKGIPYDAVGPVITEKVKYLILIGKTGPKILEAVRAAGGSVPSVFCSTYQEAVETAAHVAQAGDNVVLSPASTSFDMFQNFEERGNTFKKYVNQLSVK